MFGLTDQPWTRGSGRERCQAGAGPPKPSLGRQTADRPCQCLGPGSWRLPGLLPDLDERSAVQHRIDKRTYIGSRSRRERIDRCGHITHDVTSAPETTTYRARHGRNSEPSKGRRYCERPAHNRDRCRSQRGMCVGGSHHDSDGDSDAPLVLHRTFGSNPIHKHRPKSSERESARCTALPVHNINNHTYLVDRGGVVFNPRLEITSVAGDVHHLPHTRVAITGDCRSHVAQQGSCRQISWNTDAV